MRDFFVALFMAVACLAALGGILYFLSKRYSKPAEAPPVQSGPFDDEIQQQTNFQRFKNMVSKNKPPESRPDTRSKF